MAELADADAIAGTTDGEGAFGPGQSSVGGTLASAGERWKDAAVATGLFQKSSVAKGRNFKVPSVS